MTLTDGMDIFIKALCNDSFMKLEVFGSNTLIDLMARIEEVGRILIVDQALCFKGCMLTSKPGEPLDPDRTLKDWDIHHRSLIRIDAWQQHTLNYNGFYSISLLKTKPSPRLWVSPRPPRRFRWNQHVFIPPEATKGAIW